MAKLPFSLVGADSRRVGGCQKPECEADGTLHRHHKRHEAMWLGIWAGRRRTEPKWHTFVERYYKFLPEDTVILCPDHHAEIHNIYDKIIQADIKKTKTPLSKYSWRQAEILMNKLEQECLEWIRTKSQGIPYEKYDRKRKRRQRRKGSGSYKKQ